MHQSKQVQKISSCTYLVHDDKVDRILLGVLKVDEPEGVALWVKALEVLIVERIGHVRALPEALEADRVKVLGRRVAVQALPCVQHHLARRQQVERVFGLGCRLGLLLLGAILVRLMGLTH